MEYFDARDAARLFALTLASGRIELEGVRDAALPSAHWEASYNPSPAPGLDSTSAGWANGAYGTQAQWVYTVPRDAEDLGRYGTTPSTWISELWMENVWYRAGGSASNYPAMVIGLADPGSAGWWSNDAVHYGGQGELSEAVFDLKNETGDHATKAADFDLVTYENESPARYREAYVGDAAVALVDEDAPRVLQLSGPTEWITGARTGLSYEFEDDGLGVRSAAVKLAGEKSFKPWWGADFNCYGTAISPCPRVAASTEAGRPELVIVPSELPTGLDLLEVVAFDPLLEPGHEASKDIEVKVDNTPPEINLSGPLTEQESLGMTQAEYPLAISVADGTEDVPQSGVASVELKVDGEKIAMADEAAWHPACHTQNCSFSGGWTLKASEYSPGPHEVEVTATDAIGHTSTTTLEVELGDEPLQTVFTSPHPSHAAGSISSVSFKATRGGATVEGATFTCSLDGSGEAPAEPCTSPYELPEGFKPGWHTLLVAAHEGEASDPTPARWTFDTAIYPQAPSTESVVYPEVGKKTAGYYTLEAKWGENPEGRAGQGVTGVTFQWRLPGTTTNEKGETVPRLFETVPAECTIDGHGKEVSWPLPARSHPGHSAPVYLKPRGCPVFEAAGWPEQDIEFRAVFDGGEQVAGASKPVATEYVLRYNLNVVSTDATESVGPASVDLLTGGFTLSHTDVSIPVPGYEANLEFTRTYSSTVNGNHLPGFTAVLGTSWQPSSPLESEYEGEAWSRVEEKVIPKVEEVKAPYCWPEYEEEEDEEGNLVVVGEVEHCKEVVVQEEEPAVRWIELIDNEGAGVPFEIKGDKYVAPEYAKELALTMEGGNFVLGYPNGTHTTFVPGGERVWLPKYISYQSSPSSMRLVYESEQGGKGLRLMAEIAPAPAGDECETLESAVRHNGCRTLAFEYGTNLGYNTELLDGIWYYGPWGTASGAGGQKVAQYTYQAVGGAIQLVAETDPRLPNLPETYGYEPGAWANLLDSVTPPGQEPWGFEYEFAAAPRLKAVTRAGEKTTLAYHVPLEGSRAPYDLSAANIAGWGQSDLPVNATAVFPPNHEPSEFPPAEYGGATVHYMDPEGHEVDTASPSPPGVAGASITTTETNVHGNVVRELSAQNRLLALESPDPPARSHELDTHSVYSADGNEMLESWGPLHQVTLASGEEVGAREHTVTHYDEGEPARPVGTPPAYLPTRETVAAVVPGQEGELEPRLTETRYNWTLRKPHEEIVDPGGLDIRTMTVYNSRGQVVETRQPKAVGGGSAGDTRTTFWSPGGSGECNGNRIYAYLPCKVQPVAQASGAGRPQLPVKTFQSYNYLDEPTKVGEGPPGEGFARTTRTTYDYAGRELTTKIEGGGRAIPKTETVYSPTLGVPTQQRFVCEAECTGFDNQATTTTYNALGQVTKYEDADGGITEATYDAYGRPATVTDPRGTQTFHYDEASGLLTGMEVSGVGTFTATYDADRNLIERGLPNGLTAKTNYNQADEPMKLAYTKVSSCGESCTWYKESVERSIEGRILNGTSSLVENRYSYDKAGRLTEAQETPAKGLTEEGKCMIRAYTYDADSNRLTKTTRPPGVGGACATSEGATESYSYDEADRLIGPTYDSWGRITNLPAEFDGGEALTTGYFANNMVATQSQNWMMPGSSLLGDQAASVSCR